MNAPRPPGVVITAMTQPWPASTRVATSLATPFSRASTSPGGPVRASAWLTLRFAHG